LLSSCATKSFISTSPPIDTYWVFTDSIANTRERIKLVEKFVYSLDKEKIIGTWSHWWNDTVGLYTIIGEPIVYGLWDKGKIVTHDEEVISDIIISAEGKTLERITDKEIIERYKDIDKDTALAAMFPPYNEILTGSNKVIIDNSHINSTIPALFIGLYSNGNAKIFYCTRGSTGVDVPNGSYDIYFIYANELESLYKGDSFSLNNTDVKISLTAVEGGNFNIEKVE
jgi:hypothetical protein